MSVADAGVQYEHVTCAPFAQVRELGPGTAGAVVSAMASPAVSRVFVEPQTARAQPCVLALAFDSHELASAALSAAHKLEERNELVVHDAVVLGDAVHGQAHVLSRMNPAVVAATVPATLLGALIGTLVAGPIGLLVGGAIGGGSGALLAQRADTGIPEHVVETLRATVGPDQFLVALLVSDVRDGATVGLAMRCGTLGRSTIVPV